MSERPWASTLAHLRLPFSFFLLPIYLFGVQSATHISWQRAVGAGLIIHLLLYPASQAFNSWYDRDEGPIGGLKTPPPVHVSLAWTAWILDGLALVAAWFLGLVFFVSLVIYTLGSKSYSWQVTRLKSRPVAGWLGIGLFQGGLIYLATVQTVGTPVSWTAPSLWLGALTATLFLLGVYPLTQVYQHEEDARHGDMTISRKVGIRGTFVLSAVFLTLAVGFFVLRFSTGARPFLAWIFLAVQAPTLVYFLAWLARVWVDTSKADFRRTMSMNLMASGFMNAFFILAFWP